VKVALLVMSVTPFAVTPKGGLGTLSAATKVQVFGSTERLVTVMNTVAEAVPLSPCAEAVIVAVPMVCPVATPLFSSIVRIDGSLLVHATPLERRERELSSKVPKACNVVVALSMTVGSGGWTATETSEFGWKKSRQPTPKASATRTVKAIVNASLRPVNIDELPLIILQF
jgi:hypothetical protein